MKKKYLRVKLIVPRNFSFRNTGSDYAREGEKYLLQGSIMMVFFFFEALSVELTEVDYSVDRNAAFFTGLVRTSTIRTQEPAEILLLPLTIAEYNDIMFSTAPCDIPRDARPAQSKSL